VRIILFGGGLAGRLAALKLSADCPEQLAGIVWDEDTGEPPPLPEVPFYTEADCSGVADTLFCSGYGRILGPELLRAFPRGCFNAHSSLLPRYRGRHAIQWAIASGERELGVSVHRMGDKIDRGEVLLVRSQHFGLEADLVEVSRELAEMAADMLVELCRRLEREDFPAPELRDLPREPYWRRRRPEDSRISWQDGAAAILNVVRASAGKDYPAYAFLPDGTKVSFTGYLASDTSGKVLYVAPEGCLIAAGDGVVWLTCDHPLKKGDILK